MKSYPGVLRDFVLLMKKNDVADFVKSGDIFLFTLLETVVHGSFERLRAILL